MGKEMIFELIRDRTKLKGTAYFEFLPGEFAGNFWNPDSVYLSEKSLSIFEGRLKSINERYDHYAFVYFDRHQTQLLVDYLNSLIGNLDSGKGLEFSESHFVSEYKMELNSNVFSDRNDLRTMLTELVDWLNSKTVAESGVAILGI